MSTVGDYYDSATPAPEREVYVCPTCEGWQIGVPYRMPPAELEALLAEHIYACPA